MGYMALYTAAVLAPLIIMVASDDNSKLLYKQLFSDYTAIKPPGKVTVHLGASIITVVDDVIYRDTTADVTAQFWRRMLWRDPSLAWDPADYGGVTTLRVPSSKVWIPDIYLYNSLTAVEEFDSRTMAILYNSGDVLYIPRSNDHFRCARQRSEESEVLHCYLKFASWAYDGFEVDYALYEDTGMYWTNFESAEYSLAVLESRIFHVEYPCCEEPYPYVRFNFTLTPNA